MDSFVIDHRWHYVLAPTISRKVWSRQEDVILRRYHREYGNKWAMIAKHLPGR